MAEIKAAQADAFVEKPDAGFRVFLVFGPNAGLVSERADTLATKFGVNPADLLATTRLDADQACAQPGRLADEAASIGMFGGPRLIRISGSTRRNLADALRPVLEFPPSDCWLIVEAGDLKRDSALRRLVERSKSGISIACYADGDRDLDRLITTDLHQSGLVIDADARQVLRSILGADRRTTRNEIAKLALYCEGRGRVTVADVLAIVGDSAAAETDGVIDAAACGSQDRLQALLPRLLSGLSADMVILFTLRHFQALHAARYRLESQRQPVEAVIAAQRPPVNMMRRRDFETALRLWPLQGLARAMDRLDRVSLEARARPALGPALAGATLMAIAQEAERNRRRGSG